MANKLLDRREMDGTMPKTRWTLIGRAGADATGREEALEILIRDYRPPVCAYISSWGYSPEDTEDLAQSFFCDFIRRDAFAGASEGNGKFRSWLLACLKNFLCTEWRARTRQKRNPDGEVLSIDAWPDDRLMDRGESPDAAFDRAWALGLLERALKHVEESCRRKGNLRHFEVLLPLIAGLDDRGGFAAAGKALGISEGAARVAAFRMRTSLRRMVREEIESTVGSEAEIEEELQHFYECLRGA